MKEAVKTIKRGRFTGCIWYDENPENPRRWENVGKIIAYPKYLKSECTAEYLKASEVSLPVYGLDHGGISVSTTPYNIRWDSGLIGYICVTDDDAREKLFGKDEEVTLAEIRKRAEAVLRGEIETLDQYMSGEMYYFTVEDEKGVVVDTCGGLYGLDYTEEVLMDSLEHLDELDFPLFTSTGLEVPEQDNN